MSSQVRLLPTLIGAAGVLLCLRLGALAANDVATGLFHQVTTRHMFERLMKREPNLDATSQDFEGDLLDGIAKEFQASEDLKVLVKRLVQLPTYRRMP